MATKAEMAEHMQNTIVDNRLLSVNGRDFVHENVINFAFDCKYNKLQSDKARDNFFIENSLTSFDYAQFREELIYYIDEKYPKEYIDWDNSGFYGRSGGNYCISFQAGALDDVYSHCFEDLKDMYDYKEFLTMFKEIKTYEKIVSDVKQYMFSWFTGSLENITTWSYDNMGFMTLTHPDYKDTVFIQDECSILAFCKDNNITVCALSSGDVGAFNDWDNQYFSEV